MRLAIMVSLLVMPMASDAAILDDRTPSPERVISSEAGLPIAQRCWQLRWSDEFDGTSLDLTKWSGVKPIARGPGFWDPSELRVENGVAQFLVKYVNGKYVTAATQSRFSAAEGYFVIRAKLPSAPGVRPAFWLSSELINAVNDPRHPTEIDVIEYPSRDGRVRQNLHWNGYGADHQTVGNTMPATIDPSQFHTFGVWWNNTSYRFYVDGKLTWVARGGGISKTPEFMRLGNEILPEDAKLPRPTDAQLAAGEGTFTVDYVRVYRGGDCGKSP